MTIEDDIAFLQRVPALAILGRDALRILAIGSESRRIPEGISLFAEGEDADGAYVVQEGSFELVSREEGAAEPTVVGPGDGRLRRAFFTRHKFERALLHHIGAVRVLALGEQRNTFRNPPAFRTDRQNAQRIAPEDRQRRNALQEG